MEQRRKVKLCDSLGGAYKEMLRQPHDEFRVTHQALMSELRDALAELHGTTAEQTHDYFEQLVATEDDETTKDR